MSEKKLELNPCVGCKKCLPCFMSVNIPEIFRIYSDYVKDGNEKKAAEAYDNLKNYEKAPNCVTCNQCIQKCPLHINVPVMLQIADDTLTVLNK